MRIRHRRNPKTPYTAAQKGDLQRADIMTVRARILELGVSKFLEDDYGQDMTGTRTAAEMLHNAAALRADAEEIYTRIRREAAAAEHFEETETELAN